MFTLEIQAVCSSKTLITTYQTKRRLLIEEGNLEIYISGLRDVDRLWT